jgi:hypothetical protein
MRTFTLTEVISASRVAENVSTDGAALRFRPDQQILGRPVIIEVAWPGDAPGGSFGLVEVAPDVSGELLVARAEVPDDISSSSASMRLPLIPTDGWRHEAGCACHDCRD